MRHSPVVLILALLSIAATCGESGSSSGSPTPTVFEVTHQPMYCSGDFGQIAVNGAAVEATMRFTLSPDEYPVAVHLEAAYVPAPGNTAPAQAELWLYDTLADNLASNDVLIGANPPSSPFGRGRLSADTPGTFSILTPLGAGTDQAVGPKVATLGVRIRINTTSWVGTVTSFKIRVVTVKVSESDAALSFVRDS